MPEEIHVDDLGRYVGKEYVSSWRLVDQETIDRFAAVTGDQHWVHVDVPRAEAVRGFTIAHGLLTLSLFPVLWYELYQFAGATTQLNYGFDKVRFTGVVPAGSRIRLRAAIAEVEQRPTGVVVGQTLTFEREGDERPVCVGISRIALYR